MRLVASPHLIDEDIAAIRSGYEARADVIERALLRGLNSADMPDLIHKRLEFLTSLVAQERLDIKIAVLVGDDDNIGMYHEKVGIFFDDRDDVIVFTGSANESVGGLVRNFEALEVFRSWRPEDEERVHRWVADFEALWSNRTSGLLVHEFPAAIHQRLLEGYQPSRRPHRDPEHPVDAIVVDGHAPFGQPKIPDHVELRDYQRKAVREWFAANGRGLWEMATGSGKTFAALAATSQVYRRLADSRRSLAVVVLCPFQHLVDQWADAAAVFGIRAIRCAGPRDTWMPVLGSALSAAAVNEVSFVFAVATNQTFAGDAFQAHLLPFRGDLLLIGDEVHNLGAPTLLRALPERAAYRLGLSATPERQYDPVGTLEIYNYFGESVFTFTLAEAIAAGALVPYRYHPVLVALSDSEEEGYLRLTERIAKLAGRREDLEPGSARGSLEMALFERARLLGRAAAKVPALQQLMEPMKGSTHNLVYCADSPVEQFGEISQLDAVVFALGRNLGMQVNTYTDKTSRADREDRRRRLANGSLQALAAIRCLDEGVDIPEAQRGFILASTTNPRQFVQRRGRLLRPSPGKRRAELYDFLVVPPEVSKDQKIWQTERHLVARELARVMELADAAENGPEALSLLLDLRRRYHLLDMGSN
jgi:DNA phosphorothioation system restriction enzyme